MKKTLVFIIFAVLAGCSEEERHIVKTTHAEIEQKFSENGAAANLFYKDKTIELTDTVNSVQSGGNVVLVDDKIQPYIVNVNADSYPKLAKLKAGDKLTVRCNFVDYELISWCDVPEH